MLRFNPRRAMRGQAEIVSPTNYGTVCLYNNGSGADILGVWLASSAPASSNSFVRYGQGIVGTKGGTALPVVTGDTVQSGYLTTLDAASAYTDFIATLAGYSATDALTPSTFPSYFLQPGWSLCVQCAQPANNQIAFFLWSAMHAEDVQGRPCPVCDVQIVVATP